MEIIDHNMITYMYTIHISNHCTGFKWIYLTDTENEKINILPLQFFPLMGNKSSGAIFGTFICQFLILTALSELNVPLRKKNVRNNWNRKTIPFIG